MIPFSGFPCGWASEITSSHPIMEGATPMAMETSIVDGLEWKMTSIHHQWLNDRMVPAYG